MAAVVEEVADSAEVVDLEEVAVNPEVDSSLEVVVVAITEVAAVVITEGDIKEAVAGDIQVVAAAALADVAAVDTQAEVVEDLSVSPLHLRLLALMVEAVTMEKNKVKIYHFFSYRKLIVTCFQLNISATTTRHTTSI